MGGLEKTKIRAPRAGGRVSTSLQYPQLEAEASRCPHEPTWPRKWICFWGDGHFCHRPQGGKSKAALRVPFYTAARPFACPPGGW